MSEALSGPATVAEATPAATDAEARFETAALTIFGAGVGGGGGGMTV